MTHKIFLAGIQSKIQARKLAKSKFAGNRYSNEVQYLDGSKFSSNPEYLELVRLVQNYNMNVYLTCEKTDGKTSDYKIHIRHNQKHVFTMHFVSFDSMFQIARESVQGYLTRNLKKHFEKFLSIKPEVRRIQKI